MTYTKCGCKLCKCASFSTERGICTLCKTYVHQDHFCLINLNHADGKLVCVKCETTWIEEGDATTELEMKAEALFNCPKSVLNFLIESSGIIGATEQTKKKILKQGIKL